MKNLVVRCEGNGDVATVALQYRLDTDCVHIAELVQGPSLTRRVNPETLTLGDYPELSDLLTANWQWDMETVEALVVGYLNRQSEARIRLHQEWEAELRRQWVEAKSVNQGNV